MASLLSENAMIEHWRGFPGHWHQPTATPTAETPSDPLDSQGIHEGVFRVPWLGVGLGALAWVLIVLAFVASCVMER